MFISSSRFQRAVTLLVAGTVFAAGYSLSRAAAPIESSLESILSSAPPDSTVTVLVTPSRRFDLIELENQLIRTRASRRLRHQRVVERLKLETGRAQASLIDYLNSERRRGRVKSYRAFWIANVIAVTMSADRVAALAARSDVELVMENRKLTLMADKSKSKSGSSSLAQSGIALAQTEKVFSWALEKINVRPLWQRGITGRGILVGNIDSGVDGTHPALASKWRGANGATSTESWFDAINGKSFPYDDYLGTHGTKTMGCMLGQSGADTVGVAPDAQWIAAKAFSQQTGDADIVLQCMEWMADPDQDQATVDDVPDILNLSFGDKANNNECIMTYWDALDNLKMLGVVPICASGNKGDTAHGFKVAAPANSPRYFAVTAVDSLWQYKSHSLPGPSYCDPNTIKPDVVAPGDYVLTTKGTQFTPELYDTDSGSSFSAPLVAGVAALVRQANPELTPDQIYGKLRSSAIDLGVAGPDTLFGYGAVDADSAVILAGSPTRPWLAITRIELAAGDDSLVSPGEDIGVVLTLVNNGLTAVSVSALVESNSSDVTVTSGTANFGAVAHAATARNSSSPFTLSFSQSIPLAEIRTFNVKLTIGLSNTQTLAFAVGVGGEPVPPVEGYAAHDANQAGLTVTNFGKLGIDNSNGGGFVYPRLSAASPDHLFRGALLVGTGSQTISDASYVDTDYNLHPTGVNKDFAPMLGGNIEIHQPGEYADQEITGKYDDSQAPIPLKLIVSQHSYAWSDQKYQDFVIMTYDLSTSSDSAINGVYAAEHMDWDVGQTSDNDLIAFDRKHSIAYMFDVSGYYMAQVLLTQHVSGHAALNWTDDIRDGFTGQEKFAAMTNMPDDTVITSFSDWSQLIAAGPIKLKPGSTVSVAFAIVGAIGLANLVGNMDAARAKWAELAAAKGIDTTPPVLTVTPIINQAPQMQNYRLDAAAQDSEAVVEDVSVVWRDISPQASGWTTTKAADLFNGNYSAVLPGRPEGTRVQYFVRAIDTQGNQGLQPPGAPQELYAFYVGDTTRPVILSSSIRAIGSAGIEVSARVTDLDLKTVFLILLPDSLAADTLHMAPAGGDTYSAVVSGLEPGSEVSYFIEASDTLGNFQRYPSAAPDELLQLVYTAVLAGDGDLNGKVDIFDLLAMLKVISGKKAPSAGELEAMDLDANGKVDIFDLLELLKLLKAGH